MKLMLLPVAVLVAMTLPETMSAQGGSGQAGSGLAPAAQPTDTFDDPRGRDRRGRGRSFGSWIRNDEGKIPVAVPAEQPAGAETVMVGAAGAAPAPGLQGGSGQSGSGLAPAAQPSMTFDDPRGRDRRGRGRSFGLSEPMRDAVANSPDIALADRVRLELTSDASLSASARKIKVGARDGRVTLRGKVADEAERAWVLEKAAGIAGSDMVVDKLKVAQR